VKLLIVPLTKSPWPRGRIGPLECQDWFSSVRIAVRLQRSHESSVILIVSDLHVQNESSEQEWYALALRKAGAAPGTYIQRKQAYETLEQLEVVEEMARAQPYRVAIISTFTHYPRVRWLCRGKGYEHYVAWGIPRLRDVLTDAVLMVAFPILDLMGARAWFRALLKRRRTAGKF
jgi:hypothetical protein